MMYAADFRRMAREALRGRWPLAIGATLVALLLGGVPNSSVSLNIDADDLEIFYEFSPDLAEFILKLLTFTAILAVIAFVIGGVVSLGYCLFSLDIVDHRETRFGMIFSQFPRFWDGFCLKFLTGLYTALWTLLLIIPGIIASYSYAMAPYIMAENPDCRANQALTESEEMMRGNRWRLFCLEFSFIGWSLLSVFTLGIGSLWLNPYMAVSRAAFYREISGSWGENAEELHVTLEY